MTMSLKQAIDHWDGKSADDIAEIYKSYSGKTGFVDSLISLVSVNSAEKGATWLLKAWLDQGGAVTKAQSDGIIACFDSLRYWESKLHLLQSLSSLAIDVERKLLVERFLRSTLVDNNKFVRAWSYHGFYELARRYPEYKEETKRFFDMAMKDEAASVKARIRNILKSGF